MTVTVKIPTPLRNLTAQKDKVSADGTSVAGVIDALNEQHPGMKDRLCDDDGALRHFVNIYVNGEDVRYMAGIDTQVSDGDELSIVPAVAGGI